MASSVDKAEAGAKPLEPPIKGDRETGSIYFGDRKIRLKEVSEKGVVKDITGVMFDTVFHEMLVGKEGRKLLEEFKEGEKTKLTLSSNQVTVTREKVGQDEKTEDLTNRVENTFKTQVGIAIEQLTKAETHKTNIRGCIKEYEIKHGKYSSEQLVAMCDQILTEPNINILEGMGGPSSGTGTFHGQLRKEVENLPLLAALNAIRNEEFLELQKQLKGKSPRITPKEEAEQLSKLLKHTKVDVKKTPLMTYLAATAKKTPLSLSFTKGDQTFTVTHSVYKSTPDIKNKQNAYRQDHSAPSTVDQVPPFKNQLEYTDHCTNLTAITLKDGKENTKVIGIGSGKTPSKERLEDLEEFALKEQLKTNPPAVLTKSKEGQYEFEVCTNTYMDYSELKALKDLFTGEREPTFLAEIEKNLQSWDDKKTVSIHNPDPKKYGAGEKVNVTLKRPILHVETVSVCAEYSILEPKDAQQINFMGNQQFLLRHLKQLPDGRLSGDDLKNLKDASKELDTVFQEILPLKAQSDYLITGQGKESDGILDFDKAVPAFLKNKEKLFEKSVLDQLAGKKTPFEKYVNALAGFLLQRMITLQDTKDPVLKKEFNTLLGLYCLNFQKAPPPPDKRQALVNQITANEVQFSIFADGKDKLHPAFSQLFCKIVTDNIGVPLCLQCKSGQDRTGFGKALIIAHALYEKATGEPFIPPLYDDQLTSKNHKFLLFKLFFRKAVFEIASPAIIGSRGMAEFSKGGKDCMKVFNALLLNAEDVDNEGEFLDSMGVDLTEVQNGDVQGLTYDNLKQHKSGHFNGTFERLETANLNMYGKDSCREDIEKAQKKFEGVATKVNQELTKILSNCGFKQTEIPGRYNDKNEWEAQIVNKQCEVEATAIRAGLTEERIGKEEADKRIGKLHAALNTAVEKRKGDDWQQNALIYALRNILALDTQPSSLGVVNNVNQLSDGREAPLRVKVPILNLRPVKMSQQVSVAGQPNQLQQDVMTVAKDKLAAEAPPPAQKMGAEEESQSLKNIMAALPPNTTWEQKELIRKIKTDTKTKQALIAASAVGIDIEKLFDTILTALKDGYDPDLAQFCADWATNNIRPKAAANVISLLTQIQHWVANVRIQEQIEIALARADSKFMPLAGAIRIDSKFFSSSKNMEALASDVEQLSRGYYNRLCENSVLTADEHWDKFQSFAKRLSDFVQYQIMTQKKQGGQQETIEFFEKAIERLVKNGDYHSSHALYEGIQKGAGLSPFWNMLKISAKNSFLQNDETILSYNPDVKPENTIFVPQKIFDGAREIAAKAKFLDGSTNFEKLTLCSNELQPLFKGRKAVVESIQLQTKLNVWLQDHNYVNWQLQLAKQEILQIEKTAKKPKLEHVEARLFFDAQKRVEALTVAKAPKADQLKEQLNGRLQKLKENNDFMTLSDDKKKICKGIQDFFNNKNPIYKDYDSHVENLPKVLTEGTLRIEKAKLALTRDTEIGKLLRPKQLEPDQENFRKLRRIYAKKLIRFMNSPDESVKKEAFQHIRSLYNEISDRSFVDGLKDNPVDILDAQQFKKIYEQFLNTSADDLLKYCEEDEKNEIQPIINRVSASIKEAFDQNKAYLDMVNLPNPLRFLYKNRNNPFLEKVCELKSRELGKTITAEDEKNNKELVSKAKPVVDQLKEDVKKIRELDVNFDDVAFCQKMATAIYDWEESYLKLSKEVQNVYPADDFGITQMKEALKKSTWAQKPLKEIGKKIDELGLKISSVQIDEISKGIKEIIPKIFQAGTRKEFKEKLETILKQGSDIETKKIILNFLYPVTKNIQDEGFRGEFSALYTQCVSFYLLCKQLVTLEGESPELRKLLEGDGVGGGLILHLKQVLDDFPEALNFTFNITKNKFITEHDGIESIQVNSKLEAYQNKAPGLFKDANGVNTEKVAGIYKQIQDILPKIQLVDSCCSAIAQNPHTKIQEVAQGFKELFLDEDKAKTGGPILPTIEMVLTRILQKIGQLPMPEQLKYVQDDQVRQPLLEAAAVARQNLLQLDACQGWKTGSELTPEKIEKIADPIEKVRVIGTKLINLNKLADKKLYPDQQFAAQELHYLAEAHNLLSSLKTDYPILVSLIEKDLAPVDMAVEQFWQKRLGEPFLTEAEFTENCKTDEAKASFIEKQATEIANFCEYCMQQALKSPDPEIQGKALSRAKQYLRFLGIPSVEDIEKTIERMKVAGAGFPEKTKEIKRARQYLSFLGIKQKGEQEAAKKPSLLEDSLTPPFTKVLGEQSGASKDEKSVAARRDIAQAILKKAEELLSHSPFLKEIVQLQSDKLIEGVLPNKLKEDYQDIEVLCKKLPDVFNKVKAIKDTKSFLETLLEIESITRPLMVLIQSLGEQVDRVKNTIIKEREDANRKLPNTLDEDKAVWEQVKVRLPPVYGKTEAEFKGFIKVLSDAQEKLNQINQSIVNVSTQLINKMELARQTEWTKLQQEIFKHVDSCVSMFVTAASLQMLVEPPVHR